jgi:murein DD-endopeptidase MepM/ murein hydrolase activator NlpD
MLAGVALTSVLLTGSLDARAQTVPPTSPSPEPSPTPSPPPSPPPDEPDPPSDGGGGGGSGRVGDPGGGSGGGSGWQPSGTDHGPRRRKPVVDGCAALVASVPYLGGPRDTSRLAEAVQRLAGRGLGLREAWLRSVGPFPVAGPARWSNDWHVRRCEPYPHLHQGIDIFAPEGTPVVAIEDGRLSQRASGSISGLGVEIVDGDGVQYFYAHLSAFHPGLAIGQHVEQGQVLGYIGTTGNARGTSPHVHLEVQPGGVPVPPKPYVDRWLEEAERTAARLLRASRVRRPWSLSEAPSARFLRVTSLHPGQGVAVVLSPVPLPLAGSLGSGVVLGVALVAGMVAAIPLGVVGLRPRRVRRRGAGLPPPGGPRSEGFPTRLV